MTSYGSEAQVRIFDTTLRDGEQSPGASLTSEEKLEVARQLCLLGVDIMEVGFPIASPDELAAVRGIAAEAGGDGGPTIAALARAAEKDIETAWQGVEQAKNPRIHTFLATSAIHMEHKLRLSPEEVLARIGGMVRFARTFCDDVEFSPEDATRSDPAFLKEALAAAIEAGATTLNIPDTVGYAVPSEYGALIADLINGTTGGRGVCWSVHCHDDLGLATANSLAGLSAGARQAEVTVNGIGERAGNCALEEIVMALRTRRDASGLWTDIATREITRSSRMVSRLTGIEVPRNKAVVGDNAFAHEAGIHQDGMLKHAATYEIMLPADVGREKSEMVLGKHSGRHALGVRLRELGYELDPDGLERAYQHFKTVADERKEVTDADLAAIGGEEYSKPAAGYELTHLHVTTGAPRTATATVQVREPGGEEKVMASVGPGPVDAIYRAMHALMPVDAELLEYKVNSTGRGSDSLGEVTVKLRADLNGGGTRTYRGYAGDVDIVQASAKALLAGFNRLISDTAGSREESGDRQAGAAT